MATSQDLDNVNKRALNIAANYSMLDVDDALNNEVRDPNTSMHNRDGTLFANASDWYTFGNAILNESFKAMGAGPQGNIMQNFLSRLNRYGTVYAPPNMMNYGYTFITRPRFNMTTGNLLAHPVTALLSTSSEGVGANTVAFMIRMLLDTRLSLGRQVLAEETTPEDQALADAAATSGLLDIHNPFFTPLCNGLRGISGWPDFNLETATMGEDFHSGDFTFVKGSDMLVRSSELSLEFTDVQGSIILSCIFYWCLIMALQAKGVMMAYPDDIYEQRLNYTVSIYRFITDATRRNILWWSKATGCFPKSAPVGQLFNINQGEVTVSSARQFSIPFTVNTVEYNNPGILFDFRSLVRRYVGDDNGFDNPNVWPIVPDNYETKALLPYWNYVGLPDIITGNTGLELVWKTNKDYYGDNWPTTVTQQNNHIVYKNTNEIDKAESAIISNVSRNIDIATSKLKMSNTNRNTVQNTLRNHPANSTASTTFNLM